MRKIAGTVKIEIPISIIDKTEPELTNLVRKVSKFDESAEKTQKTLSKWMKQKYEVFLELKDRVSPVLNIIEKGIKSVTGKVRSVTLKAVDLVTSPVRGILSLLRNPVFQAGAVLGISIGLTDTINTFKDFEAAMSQVEAISGAGAAGMEKLTEKAKEMGATTKFTATEAAEAFNYMAMAGWETEDMLGRIEGILNLAAASGTELGATSDIVTDALTAFRLEASEAGHFADVLAAASSKSNTNVSMMGETFKYAGAMAGTLGYRIEDVALATGLMANAGIKGNMAGTALNSIFTRLSTNTNGASDALEELGIAYFNTDGSAREFKDIINELRTATANYTDEQKANLANTVAGTYAQKGFLAILNATTKDYDKLSEAVEHADGAAQNMADIMMDNLQGSITLLQSAVDGVKRSAGERLAPYIRSAAEWLTDMMPYIEAGLEEFMDFVENKINRLQTRLKEISGTTEWQNADFFGKVKIAWREIVAEPFIEWWGSEGKQMLSEKARDVGQAIGSGISSGVMMLFGIDVSDTLNEGASVGKAFASGFADGFDFEQISGKLWEGLKGLFSNASKLLPGGESADLSSFVSAILLSKIAAPLISLGKGTFSLGKAVFGTPAGSDMSLMGYMLGSAGAGTGIKGGLASLGMIGANLTSTSLGGYTGLLGSQAAGISGAGLIGAGVAGVAGGVIGGASLISGGLDIYKAIKSEDKDESAALAESGAWKVGGTAAGAAIGTMILPGLGTLIGAGVGGLAGWIKGNKVKKEYEEQLAEAQEEAAKAQKVMEATGFSISEVIFETDALNDAINDTEVSAEQLGVMFQEAVGNKLKNDFGDIHLSLKEIQDVASRIVFDKQTDSINKFLEATRTGSSVFETLQSHMNSLEKMNWKLSLGMELDERDMERYKEAVDDLSSQAKEYLEDKHYEATAALEILSGENGIRTGGLDNAYAKLNTQVEEANAELQRVMAESLSDGVISTDDLITFHIGDVDYEMDEASAVAKLQEKMMEITEKVSQAQEDAKFTSMKIKFGGSALDAESFESLQQELAANVQSMTESYDSALEVSLTNLNLQLSEGAIDSTQYYEMLREIQEGYNAQIDGLQIRVESFQLEAIAEALGSELDGILPEIEGTTAEKLTEAMNRALAVEPDVATWTAEDIAGWFGLDNLSGETQMELAELLQLTAATIPEKITEAVSSADYSKAAEAARKGITDGLIDQAMLEGIDLEEMGMIITSGMEAALAAADYESAGLAVANGVGSAVGSADMAEIEAGIDMIYNNTASQIDSAFAENPFTTEADVKVKLNWELVNPIADLNIGRGGSTTVTANISGNVSKNASGGFVQGKQLSWLAEEGYGEFVIPTNPSRRERALELYEQAGKMLGVGTHADGGFVGNAVSGGIVADYSLWKDINKMAPISYNEATEDAYDVKAAQSYGFIAGADENGEGTTVQVNVNVSPEFVINGSNGQNEDDIIQVIRKQMKEMADELGGEIAEKLEQVFSNMPLKEG